MTDSVGARLRQGRELRGLTLQQASESTKVRAHYLQALENDDYSVIPSAAQARGFLRIYAEFLELDVGSLIPSAPPAAAAREEDSSPALEAAASQAGRTTLWSSLLGRIGRRPNKVPTPSASSEPAPEATAPQPAEAATVSAAAEAKTVRHRKGATVAVSGTASATADVKKNEGK